MLPDADEGAVDALEEMIGQMEPITTTISRLQESRKGWTDTALVRAMVAEIFSGLPEEYEIKILEEREIKWDCDCSRERIEQALMTIGEEDLQQILDEDGQAELQCQFCLKKYQFDRPQLQAILDSISK